jgi:type I restriction enzyme S subunit
MTDEGLLPLCVTADEVSAPPDWAVIRIADAYEQLPIGQRYDKKSTTPEGRVPVIDQSLDGVIGYHDNEPGVVASPDRPVVTFANHTCTMRVMKTDFSVIQNVFPMVGKPNLCATEFLYYATNSRQGTEEYKGHHPAWRNSFFAVPAPNIQRRIVGILKAFDNLIDNNRRRIELLEQMAQAIHREWFVHFRYPGHEDTALVDSPLGPIPEGWGVKPLGEVANINVESRRPAPDKAIRYLEISGLGDRQLATPSQIPGEEAPGRARRVVRPGDIVWSMVRPSRRAHALLVDPGDDWIASTGLIVLSAAEISSTLLFEIVSAPEFSDYLVSQEGGSAYPAVKPGDFDGAQIVRPTVALDSAFHDVVGPLHRLGWELREASERVAALRDLLLPKLVTGEIDVSSLDLDAVGATE